MGEYISGSAYRYFDELLKTKEPVVPLLAYAAKKSQSTKELGIFYFSHRKQLIKRIFDTTFARLMLDNLTEFESGKQNLIISGVVRPSLPRQLEKWSGDTIVRLDQTPYSVYKGVLSIVGKNDGLPVVCATNNQVIGDIVPGIKKIVQGQRPVKIYQAIKQLEFIQVKITDVIGSKSSNTTNQTSPQQKDTLQKFEENVSFACDNDKIQARLRSLKQTLGE